MAARPGTDAVHELFLLQAGEPMRCWCWNCPIRAGGSGVSAAEAVGREVWTGHLKRGDAPDKIVGSLTDSFGWRVRIEGVRDPAVVGYLDGQVPPTLRQPAIDGEE
jgi:hypothetical protein